MTPQRWAQIREVFESAVEHPSQERADILKALCGRDLQLREEVEGLLASHDASSEFLAVPAAHLSLIISSDDAAEDYPKGYRVGPYKLQHRIGRGGMGSVWLATRSDDEFEKQVAIKMVKRGMDSHEILRRFRVERQVLANLDHPNIARLIDGRSTSEGLPYLVMEYVEGTPIDRYCEASKLSITDRLHLFRAVCSAVHYAHQNLVVHRDIKAGNILVTADGVPKLLDFGIAKLLRSDGSTLEVAQTRPDMRPMTLDYASPEQVRGELITTATDVYSLGVLLFRLLTAQMPFAAEAHSQAALQHAICEREPPRPSTLVFAEEKAALPAATQKMPAAAVQESRAKAHKRLRKKLAGDLDNIILMAMRKEAHRRYVSAEHFSDDILRYLDGLPVIAHLYTPGYQLAKLLRRNGKGVAAAVVIGGALIAIAAVSQGYANSAIAAREQSEKDLQRTRHELVAAQLRAGDPAALATAQIELNAMPGNVVARKDRAEAALALGDQRLAAGDRVAALAGYNEAFAQLRMRAKAAPRDADAQRDVLNTANKLAAMQMDVDDPFGALNTYLRGLEAAESLAALEGSHITDETRRELADTNRRVGELMLEQRGSAEEGKLKLRKALEMYNTLSVPAAGEEISNLLGKSQDRKNSGAGQVSSADPAVTSRHP